MNELPKNYDSKTAEPKWQQFWDDQKIYQFDENSSKPLFSVDTPPPYVSAAHLHVGHAMSYTQAEIIVRFYRMMGYNIFYPMGFDDNGLPTERFVETKYKIDKSKIKRSEFIDLCLKETAVGGETYKTLWKNLGLSVDWSLLYSTINERCRKISQRSFIDLYKKGLIERKNEPMLWCTQCSTALAQADIDTVEKSTQLNTIAFGEPSDNLHIATTRPELIPACVALFVNPTDARYKNLIGKTVKIPLTGHSVPVLADEEVLIDFGTGLMMVCTFGDSDDVKRWKSFKLDTRLLIEKDGRMNANYYTPIAGQTIDQARAIIIDALKTENRLIKQQHLNHQVGVHERCGTAVEFYITKQWFIRVLQLKEDLLKRGNELNWYPTHYKTLFETWVNGLKWDWCISRERYYGVPFPVWYCEKCEATIIPDDSELPVDPMGDTKSRACTACGSKNLRPETDVMDTWMTSSLTPLINARWGEEKNLMQKIYPLSARVQAFEIIRTWLFYTVAKSHMHTDSLPFKDIMVSGWGLDIHGKKMSKSKGNFVTPETVIEKYSADALRYWAASASLGSNLNWSETEVAQGRKLSTKLWNVGKFAQMHLKDYDIATEMKFDTLEIMDQWILSKLKRTLEKATGFLKEYEFFKARLEIDQFFWQDLCDNYLEICKDRLYKPEVYGHDKRQSAQFTLFTVLYHVIQMYAPYIPYITEEMYQLIYKTDASATSLHVTAWPNYKKIDVVDHAESSGDKVTAILAKVRGFKTSQSLSLGAELSSLVITGEDAAALRSLSSDLTACTRAKSVLWSGDASIHCQPFDLHVGIQL